MSTMASQIISLTIVYSTVYSGADQRKHQNSPLLTFVRGIHRSPVNSPLKGSVARRMFPFDDVIMFNVNLQALGYESKKNWQYNHKAKHDEMMWMFWDIMYMYSLSSSLDLTINAR